MGRFLGVVALVLVAAPGAAAATIVVDPRNFSPAVGALAISVDGEDAAPVGVQLATVRGKTLGWIRRPARPPTATFFWDGHIGGIPVRDGYYFVRLVVGRRIVAARPIRIDSAAPRLDALAADNGSFAFAGDSPLLTTISPNGDGFRDSAFFNFRLSEPATVTVEVARTVQTPQEPLYTRTRWLAAGSHTVEWAPPPGLGPRTYLVHLRLSDAAGNSTAYGADSPAVDRYPRAPVVRLLGIDAAFKEPSYAAAEVAQLRIATDAPALTLQIFRSGPERVFTGADNVMNGIAVDRELRFDWVRRQHAPATVRIGIGPWPSGLYYAQVTAPDGRIGYAPFVVRPPALGAHRAAVVLPASTWQAYNFWDGDGDGWGDTWYAGAPNRTVDLGRPYLRRGVIPFFRRYDLGFLHWLSWTEREVDYLADTDLDLVASGDELARAYDLIVFPGHTEYVTEHLFGVVERYRDLGGNLAFLSANNFFWHIVREGSVLRRTRPWRDLGRLEGALIGVQYIANDDGRRQGVFVVRDPADAPWLWAHTGLEQGGTFGDLVGGYGIEIDAAGAWSPPGTRVLAEIPDLVGPGRTAQMAYYETPAGAKVFAAGALDFGGSATFWPVSRMLENLWARLAAP